MALIIETIPGALSKDYMNSKLEVIELNETITKEFAQDIVNQIMDAVENRKNGIKYIFIKIHSRGGSVYETSKIITAIENAKRYCVVGTIIDSIAFSMAFPIFCTGHDGFRFISPYSQAMIHQPVPKAHGDDSHSDDHVEKEHLKKIQDKIVTIILGALKNKDKIYSEILMHDLDLNKDHDWFLDAEDMIAYGIADTMSVPDFIHHVEYRPMLILNDEKILL
jgi:ATP-dependent Clp protease protease subunit